MNARQKLNRLHLAGNVLLAGVVGTFTQSWLAFLSALAVLVGLDLYTGNVRPTSQGRCHKGRSSTPSKRKEKWHEKEQ